MKSIGRSIDKDYEPDTSSWEENYYYKCNKHPNLRTLDGLLYLVEIRLEEVEKRLLQIEGS